MKIVGHRGALGLAPENTINGFKHAISLGVDGIECDVRVTKDNIVVLHHDSAVINCLGKGFIVSQHTHKQLKQQKIDIPTLEEAIRVVNHQVTLHIEIKPGVNVSPVIDILKKFYRNGWSSNELIIRSFNLDILLSVHKALPFAEIVVLEQWSRLRAMKRAQQLSTYNICIHRRRLSGPLVRHMLKKGYTLSTFTVNSPHKAKYWAKIGLDGIITDFPDRFIERKTII